MRLFILAASAVMLAGCGPEAVQAPVVAQGFKAYRDHDSAGVQKAISELEAQLPRTSPAACSEADYAASRTQRHLLVLRALTRPSIMSMSEEARAVRLQHAVTMQDLGGGMTRSELMKLQKLQPQDCADTAEARKGQAMDVAEGMAVLALGVTVSKAWNKALQEKLGSQYEPRMSAASQTLQRNGYGVGVSTFITPG